MTEDGVQEEVVPEVEETADVSDDKVSDSKSSDSKSSDSKSSDSRSSDNGEHSGKWDKRPKYNGDYDNSDYDKGKRRKRGVGDAVLCRPLEVVVRDDRVEQAIRQLKNRMAREGVLRELKNRRHYFKPSELKRIKSREAARRRRKQARQKNGQ
jgi:small subunit ribosomal protein S21